jgi:MraZ protein
VDPDGQPRSVNDPPRGLFTAKVDDKGRLKLPVSIQQYLSSFGEDNVFITSLDARTGRIYPISVWKDNEKLFLQPTEHPEEAEDISTLADIYGGDSAIDAQGRVLIPAELRGLLGIEGQQVWLGCFKGRVNIFSADVLEQRKQRALENTQEKLRNLEKRGLR